MDEVDYTQPIIFLETGEELIVEMIEKEIGLVKVYSPDNHISDLEWTKNEHRAWWYDQYGWYDGAQESDEFFRIVNKDVRPKPSLEHIGLQD